MLPLCFKYIPLTKIIRKKNGEILFTKLVFSGVFLITFINYWIIHALFKFSCSLCYGQTHLQTGINWPASCVPASCVNGVLACRWRRYLSAPGLCSADCCFSCYLVSEKRFLDYFQSLSWPHTASQWSVLKWWNCRYKSALLCSLSLHLLCGFCTVFLIPTASNPDMNPDGLCPGSHKDRLDNPHLRSAGQQLSEISFLIFQTGNHVD